MPTAARFTARVRVRMSPAARAALDELAERHDRMMSHEVRAAIERHLRDPNLEDDTRRADLVPPPFSHASTVVIRPRTRAALEELAERSGRDLTTEMRIAIYRYLHAEGYIFDGPQRLLTA